MVELPSCVKYSMRALASQLRMRLAHQSAPAVQDQGRVGFHHVRPALSASRLDPGGVARQQSEPAACPAAAPAAAAAAPVAAAPAVSVPTSAAAPAGASDAATATPGAVPHSTRNLPLDTPFMLVGLSINCLTRSVQITHLQYRSGLCGACGAALYCTLSKPGLPCHLRAQLNSCAIGIDQDCAGLVDRYILHTEQAQPYSKTTGPKCERVGSQTLSRPQPRSKSGRRAHPGALSQVRYPRSEPIWACIYSASLSTLPASRHGVMHSHSPSVCAVPKRRSGMRTGAAFFRCPGRCLYAVR